MHGEPDDDNDSDYHPNEESDGSDDNSNSSSHDTDNDNTTTASERDNQITGVDENMCMDENNPHEHVDDYHKAMGTEANTDYSAETGKNTEEKGEAEYDPSTEIAGVEDDINNDNDINDETDDGTDNGAVQERTHHVPGHQFSTGIQMRLRD